MQRCTDLLDGICSRIDLDSQNATRVMFGGIGYCIVSCSCWAWEAYIGWRAEPGSKLGDGHTIVKHNDIYGVVARAQNFRIVLPVKQGIARLPEYGPV